MKTLLKITALSALFLLLALARLEYVRAYKIDSKEDSIGEALDPLNILSIMGLYGFGALTALLLVACILVATFRLVSRRRLISRLSKPS